MTPQPQDVWLEPHRCINCQSDSVYYTCDHCGAVWTKADELARTPTPALRAEGAEAVAATLAGAQKSLPADITQILAEHQGELYGQASSPVAAPTEAEDAAKWRKLGLCYEDDLPNDISDADYNWWYEHSQIIFGVRMGPVLTARAQLRGGGK